VEDSPLPEDRESAPQQAERDDDEIVRPERETLARDTGPELALAAVEGKLDGRGGQVSHAILRGEFTSR
jgi:hypothetical protein